MSTFEYVKSLGFPNVQEYVNSGPQCTINEDRLQEVVNFMIENGWEAVDPDSSNFSGGELIKYVTSDNEYTRKGGSRFVEYRDDLMYDEDTEMVYGSFSYKFRSGGFFIQKNAGEDGSDYILYKPHKTGQPPISVQISNIKYLYVLTKENQKKIVAKKPVYYNRPIACEKSKFPVKLVDKCGLEVVIYYAKDNYKYNRFLSSAKYARAQKNGWKFL